MEVEKTGAPAPAEKKSWWARGVDKVDITPQVIRDDVMFTTVRFREGYNQSEVDDFLDRCADKMEAVMNENNAMKVMLHRLGINVEQAMLGLSQPESLADPAELRTLGRHAAPSPAAEVPKLTLPGDQS
jgi:DivIVA domain-containing protein